MSKDPRPNRPSQRRRRPTAHPAQEAPGVAARRGAVALLAAVLEEGAMLDEARLERLAPPLRAEARALADLTLRRLGEVDHALRALVERQPKSPGREILRLMAAELLFGGTAAHAAVDSAVRVARATRGAERLSGLVNAVGRRLAESGPPEEGPAARRRNAPAWLLKRLQADWGKAETDAILAAHLAPAPHDLVLRDPEAPAPEGLEGARLPGGVIRLAARPQISALPGYETGAWWVQDWAATLPARLLGPVSGLRVLDLCAAPGGKTMQLAAAGARVTALDLSEGRMARLAANLERTGLAAETVVADALDWAPEAPFDAILLDAPCSATGTLRRHPDLPWRRGAGDVETLAARQAALLDRAWGWLAPGGRLVFATCSLLRAEGEDQAAAFRDRTPEARSLPVTPGAAVTAEMITPEGDLRTRPTMMAGAGGMDGFFAARFGREG